MTKPILLVEDEQADVMFMQMAMQAAGVKNRLLILRDGREAVAFLKGAGPYADRQQWPLPGLVLLDLRLPYVPGIEVLRSIRQHPAFAKLPVFVLSSSDQDADVHAVYRAGANAYIVKPPLVSHLKRVVRLIKQHWLDSDAPPPRCLEWEAEIVPRPPDCPVLAE